MVAVATTPKINEMAFTCPVVGPKVYITKGPSGWPETFLRKTADAKLEAFLDAIAPGATVGELVDMFIVTRELADKPEPTNWFTVIGFVARRLILKPSDIPHEIGVAFWGKIVIASTARGVN